MNRAGRKRTPKPVLNVIGPSIAYIPLSRGLYATIEIDDIPLLSVWNWFAHYDPAGDCFYAHSNNVKGQRPSILAMHRLIIQDVLMVDHANRKSLDNRRHNLREASPSQNQANAKTKRNSASGFKGVWLDKKRGKYIAYLTINGKSLYAGCSHDSPVKAYEARQELARRHFGEFAH